MPHRPLALSVLGGLQFAAFGAACVILLGESTLDGALTAGDVAVAVGIALVGAVVVGSTWNGGRVALWLQIVLAIAAAAYGVVGALDDQVWGWPLAAGGGLWLAIVALPQSRAWFTRPVT